jgi:hypothetical protein
MTDTQSITYTSDPAIARIIERIERLRADEADVDQFVEAVTQLVVEEPMSIGSGYEPGAELYRATTHHRSAPTTVADMWYPPPHLARLGRANRAGHPLFYCSPAPACTLHEIGAVDGQLAVHAKWTTTKPMLLHDLGYTDQVLARAGSRRKVPYLHREFLESIDARARAVRDYIALAFTDSSSASYPLTAAIAEVHLRADELSGILYPAISRAADVDCIALRIEFVHQGLQLSSAQLLRVEKVHLDGSIEGEVLADLSSLGSDGVLQWEYRGDRATVPPGRSRALRSEQTVRFANPCQFILDGKQYKVEAGYSLEVGAAKDVVRDLQGQIVDPL